jgi:hypothetical protein
MSRVPEQSLVQTKPLVVDENDPALQFLDRSKVVIRKSDGTTYDKYLSAPPIVGAGSASVAAGVQGIITGQGGTIIKVDTIDMTDIEGIPTYEQYYDPVSKLVKYKVTLKIRNSSSKSANVKGVDARIYNPGA